MEISHMKKVNKQYCILERIEAISTTIKDLKKSQGVNHPLINGSAPSISEVVWRKSKRGLGI